MAFFSFSVSPFPLFLMNSKKQGMLGAVNYAAFTSFPQNQSLIRTGELESCFSSIICMVISPASAISIIEHCSSSIGASE